MQGAQRAVGPQRRGERGGAGLFEAVAAHVQRRQRAVHAQEFCHMLGPRGPETVAVQPQREERAVLLQRARQRLDAARPDGVAVEVERGEVLVVFEAVPERHRAERPDLGAHEVERAQRRVRAQRRRDRRGALGLDRVPADAQRLQGPEPVTRQRLDDLCHAVEAQQVVLEQHRAQLLVRRCPSKQQPVVGRASFQHQGVCHTLDLLWRAACVAANYQTPLSQRFQIILAQLVPQTSLQACDFTFCETPQHSGRRMLLSRPLAWSFSPGLT
mmetsp:Transcript_32729/g.78199  ORF Transcript_32729/g.78199 Transcript_32729/m.78199 type:complete len:271 (-) Transcript_32729:384-1196(-)